MVFPNKNKYICLKLCFDNKVCFFHTISLSAIPYQSNKTKKAQDVFENYSSY